MYYCNHIIGHKISPTHRGQWPRPLFVKIIGALNIIHWLLSKFSIPLLLFLFFFLQFKPSSLVLTHRVLYYSNIVNNMCMGYLGLFWYWNWCIIAWLPLSPPPKIYLKIFGFNKLDFFFGLGLEFVSNSSPSPRKLVQYILRSKNRLHC